MKAELRGLLKSAGAPIAPNMNDIGPKSVGIVIRPPINYEKAIDKSGSICYATRILKFDSIRMSRAAERRLIARAAARQSDALRSDHVITFRQKRKKIMRPYGTFCLGRCTSLTSCKQRRGLLPAKEYILIIIVLKPEPLN